MHKPAGNSAYIYISACAFAVPVWSSCRPSLDRTYREEKAKSIDHPRPLPDTNPAVPTYSCLDGKTSSTLRTPQHSSDRTQNHHFSERRRESTFMDTISFLFSAELTRWLSESFPTRCSFRNSRIVEASGDELMSSTSYLEDEDCAEIGSMVCSCL